MRAGVVLALSSVLTYSIAAVLIHVPLEAQEWIAFTDDESSAWISRSMRRPPEVDVVYWSSARGRRFAILMSDLMVPEPGGSGSVVGATESVAQQKDVMVVQAGWPLPCVSASQIITTRFRQMTNGTRAHEVIHEDDGITMSYEAPGSPFGQLVIPARIQAWPFLANAMLYGVGLTVLALTMKWSRAKVRTLRGVCRACGYPRASTSICPECGRA